MPKRGGGKTHNTSCHLWKRFQRSNHPVLLETDRTSLVVNNMRYFYPALQTILLTPISSRAFSSTTSVSSAFLTANSYQSIKNKYPSSIANRQQIICNMSTESDTNTKNLVVDPFCFRQFAEKESSKGYAGAVL